MEEEERVIRRCDRVLEVAAVATRAASHLPVGSSVEAPGDSRITLDALVPVIPKPVQVRAYPEFVGAKGICARAEARHHRIRVVVGGPPQHSDGRASVWRAAGWIVI